MLIELSSVKPLYGNCTVVQDFIFMLVKIGKRSRKSFP